MQISAEYVAYSLHHLSSLSGGLPTAVVSHSQGGPLVQWALQFWPSTRNVTSAFVALSPDFAGIDYKHNMLILASGIFQDGVCHESLWQQGIGSKFYAALRSHDFKAQVPTTVVWTEQDEFVRPTTKNSQLPSAKVISVQEICPWHLTEHIGMVHNSLAFRVALDALRHSGTADPRRLGKGICGWGAGPKLESGGLDALMNHIDALSYVTYIPHDLTCMVLT